MKGLKKISTRRLPGQAWPGLFRRGSVLGLLGAALLAAACARPTPPALPSGDATLEVVLRNLRSARGAAIVSLYAGSAGFPDDVAGAAAVRSIALDGGQKTVTFPGLAPGRYALSVLHDENGDGRMETSWLGMPREGFGFSGRPRYRFGRPDYRSASFLLRAAGTRLEIPLHYETARRERREAFRSRHRGPPAGAPE